MCNIVHDTPQMASESQKENHVPFPSQLVNLF